MRMFYAGFNLYGQVVKGKDCLLKTFIEFTYESLKEIQFGHTYNLIRNDLGFFIHGAIGETREIQIINDDGIVKMSCSDDRILLLKQDGTIFKIDLGESRSLAPIPNFLNVENAIDDKDYVTDIACGKRIFVAMSKLGKIFNVPNKLDFEGRNIVQIVAGREHALLLDGFGNVYSFGIGSRGQLGHGNLDDEQNPKQIEALAGIKITKISAGCWHSCALSNTGDLYTWGWNSNGQLGLFLENEVEVSVMATPKAVDFDHCPDTNVVNVACGNRHTVVILDNKQLFGMGWNKYNQLGIPNKEENIYKISLLRDFCDENIEDLKCGPWSTAVLVK